MKNPPHLHRDLFVSLCDRASWDPMFGGFVSQGPWWGRRDGMLSPGILLDTQTGQTFSGNLAGPIAVQPSSAVSNGGTFQCHLQLQSQLKHQHQTSRYHQLERTTASASTRSSDNIFKPLPRHHRAHFTERPKLKRAVSYLVAQPCGYCHFRLQQSKLKLTAPLPLPQASTSPPGFMHCNHNRRSGAAQTRSM